MNLFKILPILNPDTANPFYGNRTNITKDIEEAQKLLKVEEPECTYRRILRKRIEIINWF